GTPATLNNNPRGKGKWWRSVFSDGRRLCHFFAGCHFFDKMDTNLRISFSGIRRLPFVHFDISFPDLLPNCLVVVGEGLFLVLEILGLPSPQTPAKPVDPAKLNRDRGVVQFDGPKFP